VRQKIPHDFEFKSHDNNFLLLNNKYDASKLKEVPNVMNSRMTFLTAENSCFMLKTASTDGTFAR